MFDHLWRVVLRLGVVFIVCLPLQIKASIISADDSTFGAGTLTPDTLQGLDFLDVTFSVGLTQQYAVSLRYTLHRGSTECKYYTSLVIPG